MKSVLKWSVMLVVVSAGLAFFGNESAEAARRHVVVRHRGVHVVAPRVVVPRAAVYAAPRVGVRVGGIVDVQVGGRYGVGVHVGHPYRPYVRYRGW